MAMWLWTSSVSGPAANYGWFEVLAVSTTKNFSRSYAFTVPNDNSTNELFRASARFEDIAEIILFTEPQLETRFTDCQITSASSSGKKGSSFNFSISFQEMSKQYNGTP